MGCAPSLQKQEFTDRSPRAGPSDPRAAHRLPLEEDMEDSAADLAGLLHSLRLGGGSGTAAIWDL